VPRPPHSLLTAAQVAELLGIDRRAVTHMANEGTIPVETKLPGRTGARLFSPTAVERILRRRAQAAARAARAAR